MATLPVVLLVALVALAGTAFGASRATFPIVTSGGGGTIAYMSIIEVQSSQAHHICWAADSTPVCGKLFCSVGRTILSEYGSIQMKEAIPETRTTGGALVLTVIGCDSDGQPTEPKTVNYQVVPTPTLTPAGPHTTQSEIEIAAPLANRICWTTTPGPTPACGGDGGCIVSQKIAGTSGRATIGTPFTALKAVACTADNIGTGMARQTYILPPTFTPASGSIAYYSAVAMVSPGATHTCWSKDGTDPKCAAQAKQLCAAGTTAFGDSATLQQLVLAARTTGGTLTIKAVGCDALNGSTEARSVTYQIVPTPTFTPAGPGVEMGTPITIKAEGAVRICWAVSSNAMPRCGAGGQCVASMGMIEGGEGAPIYVGADVTPLQAVACADGDASSGTAQQTYILQPPIASPPAPLCVDCALPHPAALVVYPEAGSVKQNDWLYAQPPEKTEYIVWSLNGGVPTCADKEPLFQVGPLKELGWKFVQVNGQSISNLVILACDAGRQALTAVSRPYTLPGGMKSGGEDEEAQGSSLGLPIILGASAGGVLALGLAAYFVWRCRHAQTNKDAAPTTAPHSSAEPHAHTSRVAQEHDARRRSSATTRV